MNKDILKQLNKSPMMTILRRELKTYFTTPVAYIIMTVFLLITGVMFFLTFFYQGEAEMREYFRQLPIIFIFIIPAITMRLFSEEKRSGSFEMLMTMPIKTRDIVVGKFLAAVSLIAIMLAPTLIYAVSIALIDSLDWGQVLSGYLGAILLAGAFSAIGLLISSFTENQIVSYFLTFVVVLFMVLLEFLVQFIPSSVAWLSSFLHYIGTNYHFFNMIKGIVDMRDLVYFASFITLILMGTIYQLEEKK